MLYNYLFINNFIRLLSLCKISKLIYKKYVKFFFSLHANEHWKLRKMRGSRVLARQTTDYLWIRRHI